MSKKGKATEDRKTQLDLKAHTEFTLKPKQNSKLNKPVSGKESPTKWILWKIESGARK